MELQELHSYIQEHQPNICQLSVLRDGNEIYSAEWNSYQRTDCVHIASATKSVIALLIGIAINHKMIGSVNDTVLSYFPEYSAKRGEKTIFDVTIRHMVVTALVVLLSIVSLTVIIVAGAKSKDCRSYGVCAAVALAMMLVGAMGMKIVPAEYFGVVERFSVFAATGFNAALGIHLFCMKPRENEE